MAAMPMVLDPSSHTWARIWPRRPLCGVRLGRLGNTRKVSNSQVEVNTDKSLIRVSKISWIPRNCA